MTRAHRRHRADGPVFVDPSGRRLRRVRVIGIAVLGAIGLYVGLVLTVFAGGPQLGLPSLPFVASAPQAAAHRAAPTSAPGPAPVPSATPAPPPGQEPAVAVAPATPPATSAPPPSTSASSPSPSPSPTGPGKSATAPGQSKKPHP